MRAGIEAVHMPPQKCSVYGLGAPAATPAQRGQNCGVQRLGKGGPALTARHLTGAWWWLLAAAMSLSLSRFSWAHSAMRALRPFGAAEMGMRRLSAERPANLGALCSCWKPRGADAAGAALGCPRSLVPNAISNTASSGDGLTGEEVRPGGQKTSAQGQEGRLLRTSPKPPAFGDSPAPPT